MKNIPPPLGIGWMVNPHNHYGPNVDGYEYDRMGTYHRAGHYGLGVDGEVGNRICTRRIWKQMPSMYDR